MQIYYKNPETSLRDFDRTVLQVLPKTKTRDTTKLYTKERKKKKDTNVNFKSVNLIGKPSKAVKNKP